MARIEIIAIKTEKYYLELVCDWDESGAIYKEKELDGETACKDYLQV